MKLSATTIIAFPRDRVFTTWRDNLPSVVPHLPSIRSVEVLERAEESAGARVQMLNLWTAKLELPAIVAKLLNTKALSWTDRAEWRQLQDERLCTWRIELCNHPGLLSASGETRFLAREQRTEVVLLGDLALDLARASAPRILAVAAKPAIEGVIASALAPNLLQAAKGVEAYLSSRSG